MLRQNATPKKLSFITVTFILGFVILTTMSAQTEPVKKFIGPEGGQLETNHSSYLIVPEGALGDAAAALEVMDNALILLEEQDDYIDDLSEDDDDPSGEWINKDDKKPTREKSKKAKEKTEDSHKKIKKGEAEEAWHEANDSITKLNELRKQIKDLFEAGKMGEIARNKVQERNDQIDGELVFSIEQLGKELQADSYECAISLDDETILAELNIALPLLESQYDYISQLVIGKDDSGEWVKNNGGKESISSKNQAIQNNVADALQNHNQDNGLGTLTNTREALDLLDQLEKKVDADVSKGKMGAVAGNNIQAYNNDIRAALEEVEALHYKTLVFEFGPEDTEFQVTAELVIPWAEIFYHDDLIWYSEDGEIIDLIELEYFINEVNETIHFFIDHFSSYYYPRR
ncbi:hypothetical protein H8E77_39955 [bacterium]|nr:hypothetical protein [bacterium]